MPEICKLKHCSHFCIPWSTRLDITETTWISQLKTLITKVNSKPARECLRLHVCMHRQITGVHNAYICRIGKGITIKRTISTTAICTVSWLMLLQYDTLQLNLQISRRHKHITMMTILWSIHKIYLSVKLIVNYQWKCKHTWRVWGTVACWRESTT